VPEDKPLTCSDCQKTFTWTSEEQEMFLRRGLDNEPKRCPACRRIRRKTRLEQGPPRRQFDRPPPRDRGFGGPRASFTVACAKCGRDAVVPFKPRGDRPVYCNECFRG
jgi:CxxC-x17-CxxC domain-containing protein